MQYLTLIFSGRISDLQNYNEEYNSILECFYTIKLSLKCVSEGNKRPYIVCEYCGKEFGSTDEFMIHVEQVHTSSDSFH
jgi:hypothetical protein